MTEQEKAPWTSFIVSPARAILCITTLSHRRFIDDAIQVVGLPVGSRIVLRYRKRYVCQNIWSAAEDQYAIRLHVVIVLGGIDANHVERYSALRVGEVINLAVSGEILTLDIALGGFAADPSNVLPKLAVLPRRSVDIGTNESVSNDLYVREFLYPANIVVDGSVSGWERAADAFFDIDAKRDVPFLFLMRGRSSGAFRRYARSGELVVESGATLDWDIHTKCAPGSGGILHPLGEVLIDISCPPMRMITSKRIRADSRRDMRKMRIACDAVFRPVSGHLSVKLVTFNAKFDESGAASGRECVSLSRHDIPIRVGRILPTIASLAAATATTGAMLEKTGLQPLETAAVAVAAGILIFLSLALGFRGVGGS